MNPNWRNTYVCFRNLQFTRCKLVHQLYSRSNSILIPSYHLIYRVKHLEWSLPNYKKFCRSVEYFLCISYSRNLFHISFHAISFALIVFSFWLYYFSAERRYLFVVNYHQHRQHILCNFRITYLCFLKYKQSQMIIITS